MEYEKKDRNFLYVTAEWNYTTGSFYSSVCVYACMNIQYCAQMSSTQNVLIQITFQLSTYKIADFRMLRFLFRLFLILFRMSTAAK